MSTHKKNPHSGPKMWHRDHKQQRARTDEEKKSTFKIPIGNIVPDSIDKDGFPVVMVRLSKNRPKIVSTKQLPAAPACFFDEKPIDGIKPTEPVAEEKEETPPETKLEFSNHQGVYMNIPIKLPLNDGSDDVAEYMMSLRVIDTPVIPTEVYCDKSERFEQLRDNIMNHDFNVPPTTAIRSWDCRPFQDIMSPCKSKNIFRNDSPKKISEYKRSNMKITTTLKCWHDCYPINGIPHVCVWRKHHKTKTYDVYGLFCSLGCARKYNAEWHRVTFNSSVRDQLTIEFERKYYNLKLQPGKRLPIAPERTALIDFGGVLTIEEFRRIASDGTETYIDTYMPYEVVPMSLVERAVGPILNCDLVEQKPKPEEEKKKDHHQGKQSTPSALRINTPQNVLSPSFDPNVCTSPLLMKRSPSSPSSPRAKSNMQPGPLFSPVVSKQSPPNPAGKPNSAFSSFWSRAMGNNEQTSEESRIINEKEETKKQYAFSELPSEKDIMTTHPKFSFDRQSENGGGDGDDLLKQTKIMQWRAYEQKRSIWARNKYPPVKPVEQAPKQQEAQEAQTVQQQNEQEATQVEKVQEPPRKRRRCANGSAQGTTSKKDEKASSVGDWRMAMQDRQSTSKTSSEKVGGKQPAKRAKKDNVAAAAPAAVKPALALKGLKHHKVTLDSTKINTLLQTITVDS